MDPDLRWTFGKIFGKEIFQSALCLPFLSLLDMKFYNIMEIWIDEETSGEIYKSLFG